MAKPLPSLEQARAFVAQIKPRSRCTTCALPSDRLEIVHTLRAEGATFVALSRLTASWGQPIQHSTLYKHFEAKHHVRG